MTAAVPVVLSAVTTLVVLLMSGELRSTALPQSIGTVLGAVTVGLLLAIVFLVPDRSGDRWALTGTRLQAARWAGYSGLLWFLDGLVLLTLTMSEQTGVGPLDPGAIGQLVFFAQHVELGRVITASLLLALVASQLALSANRSATAGWALVIAVGALVPPSLIGHSSGADDHVNSVNSLFVQSVSATVWFGGAIALTLLAPHLRRPPEAARRFAPVAAVGCTLLVLSSLDTAWLRLGSLSALRTSYGALLAGLAVLLGLLGPLGGFARWRRPTGNKMRAWFSLILMSLTMGLLTAINLSTPPVTREPVTDPDYAFTSLVGFERPPPLSWTTIFTQWYPDRMLLMLCAAMVLAYLTAQHRLRGRGDRWPLGRTLSWTTGSLLLAWVTSGGPVLYGMITFSGHMIMHMLLMMAVPPLLVAGSPITLVLRSIPIRKDASTGLREWMLAVAHSRVLRVLAHPVVAAILFSGSLIAFYLTGLYPLAMSTHTGHMLMTFHFLAGGYLFCWVLIGSDPGPPRAAHPVRLIIVMATMAVHAFVNVTLMTGTTVLAPDWWPRLGITDTAALLDDQRRGAMIAWATGDGPTLLLALAVAIGWSRSSEREARRYDRQADRDDDAQLAAYNAYLAALGNRRPEA